MVDHIHDHVALDVTASTDPLLEKPKSRTMESVVKMPKKHHIYNRCSMRPKKDVLKNIRNDPRDVEPNFNEVVHENQVLEEPGEQSSITTLIGIRCFCLLKLTTDLWVLLTARQKAVVKAFKHAWKGYKQFAWGTTILGQFLKVTPTGSV
ncbi:hypothetical protein NQ318_017935 [Aromia moschata]|uniref:Uncharacterized protein n=1 Tax=Aromia moschata TaxID=1265417 RepID=A0AAV8YAX7_9CUCU|nr:hypothetical protein NQ318_017935 [Aromia moschata]